MIQSKRTYREKSYNEQQLETGEWIDVVFEDCSFVGTDMLELRTIRCQFVRCDFTNARLNASLHHQSSFLNCRFVHVNLFLAEFHDCKMVGSTFENCFWDGLVVQHGDWSYTSMRHANLSKMDWDHVKLIEVDWYGANLRDTSLRYADLSRANVAQADLTGSDLRGSTVNGLDFSQSRLRRTRIDSVQASDVARSFGCVVEG